MGDVFDLAERAHNDRYIQQDRLRRIKNKQDQIIYGHFCHSDVVESI